jgi:hypothetical protein
VVPIGLGLSVIGAILALAAVAALFRVSARVGYREVLP